MRKPPLPEIFRQARHLLIRGVNWLGDAVMSTPAVMRLREYCAEARITLLCHEKLGELWQAHPAVDEVLTFSSEESAWKTGRRLARERFDAAVIFPNSPRSALQVWLGRVPVRVGMAAPWRRWLLTHAVPPRAGHVRMRKRTPEEIQGLLAGSLRAEAPPPREAHHLYHYLHIVGAVGARTEPLAPQIAVAPDCAERIRARLAGVSGPVVALCPGAEYGPAKRWPRENFIELAKELQRQWQAEILLVGGHHDAQVTGQIARAVGGRIRDWAGQTSLGELAAVLGACRVVIANDSGPMHLAAAVGTPVVALFGSTSPHLTAPGLPGEKRHAILYQKVPCSPCFLRECPVGYRCLKNLRVAEVLEAAAAYLRTE
ncbi:MAG: lipopolysaccharide heptosyltransferase II [Verrucomicrobiae bacterium]|nr:lipopolysaccharide heptosyltransferase II [Verrucomicrobiae bacterium]